MTRRTDRINHLIQRELGGLIQRELSDERIGFVTVSRVEVTTDLAFAKVHVSVFGSEKEKRDSLTGLNHSASFLRSQLAKVFHMRTVPKLQFLIDRNLEHGFRIQEVLRDIRENEKPPVEADAHDTENNGSEKISGREEDGKSN